MRLLIRQVRNTIAFDMPQTDESNPLSCQASALLQVGQSAAFVGL